MARREAGAAAMIALLLTACAARVDAQGSTRYVFAWPPTRYASAEVIAWRADGGGEPMDVRVSGRGVDTTLTLAPGGSARVGLTPEAQCRRGVDACALVVERVTGSGTFDAALQSPDTAGVPDTLLLSAHDTVRLAPPEACGLAHVVVSAPCPAPADFPEAVSFASVVPVRGTAHVTGDGRCAGAIDVVLRLPDVFTLTCDGEGADLTGARLDAEAPVLVISGNVVATVPMVPGSGLSADLVMDSPFPLDLLAGSTTLVIPPLPRAAAHAGEGDVVRIVAADDGNVRVRDDRGGDVTRPMSAGETWDVDTAGTPGDRTLRVDAARRVLCWQLPKSRAFRGTGDPAAVPIVPRELFTLSDRFFVPDGYGERRTVVVVAEPGAGVLMDGIPITGFSVDPGGDLEWARVDLPLPPSGLGAVHALSGNAPFGAWLFGQGGYKAHGLVAARSFPMRVPTTTVSRGTLADQLVPAASVTGTTWRDDEPGTRVYYSVDAASLLRVTKCGGAACLEW